jgi:hypothetical protein
MKLKNYKKKKRKTAKAACRFTSDCNNSLAAGAEVFRWEIFSFTGGFLIH